MVDGFGGAVFFVDDYDAGRVGGEFGGRRVDEGEDDELVADLGESGGGAVDADDAGAGLAGDDVGFEAVSVVAVGDEDGFVGEEAGGFQQVAVDRDAPVVIDVGVSDGGPVEFCLEEFGQHSSPP